MNIFVLNSGRCGSTTFIKACEHLVNYSSGHETLSNQLHHHRLAYPDNHIEADNRLSWFLGRLDEQYGNDAFYVHLTRNLEQTVSSFIKRMDYGIMQSYKDGILMNSLRPATENIPSDAQFARDYIKTVNSNIHLFLKDKTNKMDFVLENAQQDFTEFFKKIHAKGDLQLALNEWDITHNAS